MLAHALSGGLERHRGHVPASRARQRGDVLVNGLCGPAARGPGRIGGRLLRACRGSPSGPIRRRTTRPTSWRRPPGSPPRTLHDLADRLAAARHVVAVVVTGLGIPGDEARGHARRRPAHAPARLRQARPACSSSARRPTSRACSTSGCTPRCFRAIAPRRTTSRDRPWRRPGERRLPRDRAGPPGRSSRARPAERSGCSTSSGEDPVKAWPQGLCAREAIEERRLRRRAGRVSHRDRPARRRRAAGANPGRPRRLAGRRGRRAPHAPPRAASPVGPAAGRPGLRRARAAARREPARTNPSSTASSRGWFAGPTRRRRPAGSFRSSGRASGPRGPASCSTLRLNCSTPDR